MNERRAQVWAGIDAGKGHHWAAVVDDTGVTLWSKKVENDESAILTVLGEILDLADEVRWAVDISGTSSALLLALLAAHGQRADYVPGRAVNRMSGAYRGEAKTDARDAYVIAETARQRRDFATIDVPAQLAPDLALLTVHRSDLVADRVRMINRLRDVLTGVFPALERAFDYSSHKGALVLLTGYQTPAALRRRGRARLTAWLANRTVRGADAVAATAKMPPRPRRLPCPARTSPRRSLPTWRPRSWPWTTGSSGSTSRSARRSAVIRRLRSSSPCPAWVRYSAPSSSSPRAT